jgi:ribonuclease D
MQTLLNITIKEEGTLVVSSDCLKVEVEENLPSILGWRHNTLSVRDYKSQHPILLRNLIDWRREKAKAQNISAFVILTNRTLCAMSDKAPASEEELLGLSGFGPKKLAEYGSELLDLVARSIETEEGL